MKGFTIGLALVDAIPVLSFGISMVIIASRFDSPLFMLGAALGVLAAVAGKNGAAKPNVCIQCGKCMKVCETGVYMINKKLCNGCGKCAAVCPMKVMVANDNAPTTKCIACGICVKACPMEIPEIVEK